MLFSGDGPSNFLPMAETILLIAAEAATLERMRAALLPSEHRLRAVRSVPEALAGKERVSVVAVDAQVLGPSDLQALRGLSPSPLVILRSEGAPRRLDALQTHPGDVLLDAPLSAEAMLGSVEGLLAARAAERAGARPFAELLEEVTDQRPGLQPGRATSARDARLAARVARALVGAGLRLGPRHVEACLRACREVVEEELAHRSPERSAAVGDLGAITPAEALRLAASLERLAVLRLERERRWIEVWLSGESVVGIRVPEGGSPETAETELLEVMRWTRGRFELRVARALSPDAVAFEAPRALPRDSPRGGAAHRRGASGARLRRPPLDAALRARPEASRLDLSTRSSYLRGMEPVAERSLRVRWGPALAIGGLTLAAGLIGLGLGAWDAQGARGRARGLRAELTERSRAAERLRAAYAATSSAVPSALWAGLGSLAEPAEIEPPRAPAVGLVPVVGLALGAVWWVRRRWLRPLAEAVAGARLGRAAPAALREVSSAEEARLSAEAAQRVELARQLEDALSSWARGAPPGPLPESLQAAFADARAAAEARADAGRRTSRVARAALEAAARGEAEITRAALGASELWRAAATAAELAARRLDELGPRLERAEAATERRGRQLRELGSELQAGLKRAARRADELADQASRAVDAAAVERARDAKVARGGRPGPIEAPPLDRWAADLEETGRALRELAEELVLPEAPARAGDGGAVQAALSTLVDAASQATTAAEASRALSERIRDWAKVHAGGIASLLPLELDVELDALARGGLEAALADVEDRAREAESRLDALAERAERVVAVLRG